MFQGYDTLRVTFVSGLAENKMSIVFTAVAMMLSMIVAPQGSGNRKRPTIRTVVIANTYNKVPALQNALKPRILSSGRYRLSESLQDMDLVLEMDCSELSPGKTIVCAYSVDFYGKSVEPVVIGPTSPHLVVGSDPDAVAEEIYKKFLEVTEDDSILYHEDTTRQRIAMYCSDTAHKEWCQPSTVKPKP